MNKRRSFNENMLKNRYIRSRYIRKTIDSENKDLIAIKDKDSYIVLKQESLYKPLLVVFGIFLFVMIVLFPVSIFDNLWPEGMMFFRNIVRWGFFSAIATLLPLPVSIVDSNLMLSNIFTADLFTFLFTLMIIILFDTLFAFVGYKFTRTLRKLFVAKARKKEEQKANARFQKYGNLAMFVGASTPLPFTLMVYTAGALKLPKKGFILAVFLGRILKYSLFSIPMRLFGINLIDYGERLLDSFLEGNLLIEHYIIFSVTTLLILWLSLLLVRAYKKSKLV